MEWECGDSEAGVKGAGAEGGMSVAGVHRAVVNTGESVSVT